MAVLHQIDVHGIRIYTNHGCMQEEAVIGSHYEVNISVWADLSASVASDDLNDTVDYVAQIGRAHVRTPVTRGSRMPSSA